MKKTRNIWIIFSLAVLSLLAFQTLWLYNSYQTKVTEIQHKTDIAFRRAVDKEVEDRFHKHLSDTVEIWPAMPDSVAEQTTEIDTIIPFDDKEILESGVFQQILEYEGFPLNLNFLDSIFSSELQNVNLPLDYILAYRDSSEVIIEQLRRFPDAKMQQAYHSKPILIVKSRRVQAIADIPMFFVCSQMKTVLAVSFLIFSLLLLFLLYQVKIIYKQYRLIHFKEDFTHALMHDMKTPLSSVKTVLTQFKDGTMDRYPKLKENNTNIALKQVNTLATFVEKILTIAKLGERKKGIVRTPCKIVEMISDLEERFLQVPDDKSLSINSSFDFDNNQFISIDRPLIENAVGNLIDNAIKYSGEEVQIDIHCFIEQHRLFIQVRDNGIGISKKNQKTIFNRFDRSSAEGHKEVKGFGLGLNYVKRVVNAHHGRASVTSTEGEGSTFTIALPVG